MKKKIYTVFVAFISLTICFSFSAFKITQSNTAANYSHSINCQKEHYLELDCFDSCNGNQIHASSHHQHNVPHENTISSSFDALAVPLVKVISFLQESSELLIRNTLFSHFSFLSRIFRPPLFS